MSNNKLPKLTNRQSEIVRLIAKDMRLTEIASFMNLSEAAVRNHVKSVKKNLGVHSLVGIARYVYLHDGLEGNSQSLSKSSY
jgi:DNA-binding NarL/FixJ family response regulator